MIGGKPADVRRLKRIFSPVAPGVRAVLLTRSETGTASDAEQGCPRCGPTGAGHFVKVIHNII